jgi:O-antigen ligase
MVLSVPGALVISTSFEVVFDGFVKTFLMFVVMVGAVRGVRDVERLALAYLVGATIYTVAVLTQVDLGAEWRLGDLFYYDANDFAVLAVTAMPLALYFLHSRPSARARTLALMALVLLLVGFVRSGSRGGFLALLMVAGYVLFRYSAIPLRHRVKATALAALVVAGIASGQYWSQMNTIVSDADYNWTSETGRTQIWSRAVGYMLGHPVFGVGPGNFPAAEGILSPFAERQQFGIGVRWNAAHNSYLQVGAELGVTGLVLFLLIIRAAFKTLRAPRRSVGRADHRSPELNQALTASLIGFVVGAFFLSLAYHELLYTLVALAVGLHKVTSARSQHA